MILNFLKKFFGTVNERRVKSYFKIVEKINALEQNYSNLSDLELKEQTKVLKQKLADGKTLDDILPEAFATIREGAKRTLKQRHFDVQLVGGITLHNNQIAEMKTGEGKTLVSTLAVYLNALSGKGVHVVTVNDYLAKRDSEWMGQIYKFLGLSVGCILSNMADSERKEAYSCDITYGTNNEFGFDYLRDNMKFNLDEKVQRPFFFAIVDEVDSVLIDEARTPLVISGPAESNIDLYKIIDSLMVNIAPQDFQIDEKIKSINLTEQGIEKLETLLFNHQLIEEASNLFDVENVNVLHHIMQALRAHKIYRKDVDYMVRGGRVLIIDEFTGRALDGRRFSEGLHQAIEAKEQVEIHNESQTIASITFQNYFRLYPKLAGMAGTAMTEAAEFKDIYNLDVVSIPTNNPIKRSDENDEIYRTSEEKYHAIIEEIIAANKRKQPVLVGTISIEKSEHISDLLSKKSIEHQVLNAKHHENEAFIIAQAGKPSAVTIATNMAGRGTDIILGGNPEMLIKQSYLSNEKVDEDNIKTQAEKDKQIAIEAGGLYVIGTERHESRRIDDQLRGRSGRMGDPGKSKFFLSLEDDLMRIFASERISSILKTLGLKENEAIVHPLISRAIARAQARVEGHNYEIRKNLLRFDDVMNDQRKVIYEQRNEIMSNQDLDENVKEITHDVNSEIVNSNIPLRTFKEEWNLDNLSDKISEVYFTDFNIKEFIEKEDEPDNHKLIDFLNHNVAKLLSEKQQELGENIFSNAQQKILLFTIDHLWKEHLFAMDHLRHGIHLRAYGQKDPLNEYKKEAFELFTHMLSNLKELYIKRICNMRIDNSKEELPKEPSRNGTCPCGSNKKFKHCHGRLES